MKKKMILITWVSCSWKTTLQNEMLDRGYVRPLNFTTRRPRTEEAILELDKNRTDWNIDNENREWKWFISEELDEYLFLDCCQFFTKLNNWDFLEHSTYWNNWYGISSNLPEWNLCMIVDPIWKAQILAKKARWELDEYDIDTYFIEISKELQLERLENRWDSEDEIEKRKTDFIWFSPLAWDMILNWNWGVSLLADIIDWFSTKK